MLALSCFIHLNAQYYLAGTTSDSSHKPIPFVKIRLHGTGLTYESGGSGGFGIPSPNKKDSVTCVVAGYDTLRTLLTAGNINLLILTLSSQNVIKPIETNRLASLTKNLLEDPTYKLKVLGESYSEVIENGFVKTSEFPTTGFSPD